jgi:hypothetical protein
MANKKIKKFDSEAILKKVQLGQNLTKEEEVFYLMQGFGMSQEEASRILYIVDHQRPGVLMD